MTKAMKRQLINSAITGILASAGAAITALQGDIDVSYKQWIVVGLSGLILSLKDVKAILAAKNEKD